MGTPFPLNFLCGNAVPMRSRPTTPLYALQFDDSRSIWLLLARFCRQTDSVAVLRSAIHNFHRRETLKCYHS